MSKTNKRNGSVKITFKDKLFTVGYGLGASVVIIGVLFKLMYWQGANVMLTVGLVAEALVFFISAFEKPLKTYEWDKVIDFESGTLDLQIDGDFFGPLAQAAQADIQAATNIPQVSILSEEEIQKLNQSIHNLSHTANQLNELANFSVQTEKLTASIQSFSDSTGQYAANQATLLNATAALLQIYERIGSETEKIEINTQEYRTKIETINNKLAGLNSIYEIQLKDIHSQSVHFHNQVEISKKMSDDMQSVTGEMGRLRGISDDFSLATNKLKTNANELAENIAKLNAIYGNMLNANS